MDHVVTAQTKQPPADLFAIRRTPLHQLSAAQVRPVVDRIVQRGTSTATVDVATFNSSI
ncbi:hypothetical protein AB0J86_13475 [Micromonospora sp. NPDC049559]|uniref:hypothetical protein n=1 Tax=Micromonospora sp. NPDC049559 TaxID=3155923 RepID=UPI003445C109